MRIGQHIGRRGRVVDARVSQTVVFGHLRLIARTAAGALSRPAMTDEEVAVGLKALSWRMMLSSKYGLSPFVWACWLISGQNACGYSVVQNSRGKPRTSVGLKASTTPLSTRKAAGRC